MASCRRRPHADVPDADDLPNRTLLRMSRAAVMHVVVFVGCLLGTASLLHRADALPFAGEMRGKLAYFAQHGGDYDTVFVGSSRVHRDVMPQVFDRRMQELGVATHSFNLGFAGLRPHDFDTIVDQALASAPRLMRVVVELHAFDQGPRAADETEDLFDQDLATHRLQELPARLTSLWRCRLDWSERFDVLRYLLRHTSANALNVGAAPRIVTDTIARWRGQPFAGATPQPDGGWEDVMIACAAKPKRMGQYRYWREHPEVAREMLAFKRQDLIPKPLRSGFNAEAVIALGERLQARGIEPIFLVMPCWSSRFFGRDGVAVVARRFLVVDLDQPDRLPGLYDRDQWFDTDHYLAAGAAMFSAVLAEQLFANRPRSLTPR